jgi:hypothetical protein
VKFGGRFLILREGGRWYQAEAISVNGMVLCVVATRDSGFICVDAEITGNKQTLMRSVSKQVLLSSLSKAKSCIGKDNIKDVGDSMM